jgi:hypothetical protein
MPLLFPEWDKSANAAWKRFFEIGERLRPAGAPPRRLLTGTEAQSLRLPRTDLGYTDAYLRQFQMAARNLSVEAMGHILQHRSAIDSQLTDLLTRGPDLERILAERFPPEPPHNIPHSPYEDRGDFVVQPRVVATRQATDADAPTAQLVCKLGQGTAIAADSALAGCMASNDLAGIDALTLRAVLVYASLHATLEAMGAVDQMRLPDVWGHIGRSTPSHASQVQLCCWFRIGERVRVYLCPRFSNVGNTIGVSCAHAILFIQPWMNLHRQDDHSWWISLAEGSFTHFNGETGVYCPFATTFHASKGNGKDNLFYFDINQNAAALSGLLGRRVAAAVGGRTMGFYQAGDPKNRVAYSDSNASFVSFVAGEWPFDAGSMATLIVESFTGILRREIGGLQQRLQAEIRAAQ